MTRALAIRGEQSIVLTADEVVSNASHQAKLLMDIVDKTGCFQVISGKKYLQVEAWETIGAFNRVHAVTESITPIFDDGVKVGYDAKVTLLNQDGILVGAAIMPCYFTENACKGKEGDAKDKACKSAAQTFATSKAYRMNYSYVATLAGYQPTPAEEMTGDATDDRPANLEHWCEEHKTKFFKRGKMKFYAHPTGQKDKDGKDIWCNEKKPIHSVEQVAREMSEARKPAPLADPGTGHISEATTSTPDKSEPVASQEESDIISQPGRLGDKKPKRDPGTIKNIGELRAALLADFGIKAGQQLKELNLDAWTELTLTPAEAYQQVASRR